MAAASVYDEMFQMDSGEENGEPEIEASAQVIFAIGWSPHSSQQQPDQRGSAQHKVGDIVTKHSG